MKYLRDLHEICPLHGQFEFYKLMLSNLDVRGHATIVRSNLVLDSIVMMIVGVAHCLRVSVATRGLQGPYLGILSVPTMQGGHHSRA